MRFNNVGDCFLHLERSLLGYENVVFEVLKVRQVHDEYLHQPGAKLDALERLPLRLLAALEKLLRQLDDRLLWRL